MFLRIEESGERYFVGKSTEMSVTVNTTPQLWGAFMPSYKRLNPTCNDLLYSIESYPANYFQAFNPNAKFEKWAAVESSNDLEVSTDWEEYTLAEGKYAVFLFVGTVDRVPEVYQFILNTWLPENDYRLDDRPHLFVMGEKYAHGSADSEEELWIPIVWVNRRTRWVPTSAILLHLIG